MIGAGLAGLTTAQCLCGGHRLFDEVTLLERDDVTAAPASAADATQDEVICMTCGYPKVTDRAAKLSRLFDSGAARAG